MLSLGLNLEHVPAMFLTLEFAERLIDFKVCGRREGEFRLTFYSAHENLVSFLAS